ncbi:hydroxysqualene dehydroxylase HpnE [Lichenihabitans sp. Uapishka_5]|uniref:hydroxysqualene dehydroxylase HpnE n=1 Tax=Lichenihabitans sp. Uapishka_5 TaxID=3037302 RepID=UPI0029E7E4BE|nr:hydroxysqualene dehydroxylase HpnE [Lichenihabitans sp. Uapishka_5]MDX7950142.1 hydroxysqualene dehydroxylase HpnE [Lichenihabitans sp. Uapishka_5]
MPKPTVHVVGAGLAGLSAALALDPARATIVIHEAARHAGGRCRSYFDRDLGLTIDNGNHLVLSGNTAVRDHLRMTGAEHKMSGPADAVFDFMDIASGERWQVRPNAGPLPWWIFVPGRRVPGTGWSDYLALAKLLRAKSRIPIGQAMLCSGPLYDKLWRPFLVAALNTEPKDSAAGLAATVIRETLAKGAGACRPLIAHDGLAEALVEPALATLAKRGVTVGFDRRLRRLEVRDGRVVGLDFGDEQLALGPDDRVVLAVTAPVAKILLPELSVPTAFRSIVNAHFLTDAPDGFPTMLGTINSATEWIFRFPNRVSVTISDADRFLGHDKDALARQIWGEVATALGRPGQSMPTHKIITEKRATFAALPEQDALRPGHATALGNLVLAGDWVQNGLPSTIEGSLRSGKAAVAALPTWH